MSDILGVLGVYAWKILCAICVVSATHHIINFAMHYYHLAKKSGSHAKIDTWVLGVNLSAVSLILMVIATISSLAIVLQKSWVEQITSAFVIGQGFALRGVVECVLWGYIVRNNLHEHTTQKRKVTVAYGTTTVTGVVERVDLMHVYLKNENGTHAITWTTMQQYSME